MANQNSGPNTSANKADEVPAQDNLNEEQKAQSEKDLARIRSIINAQAFETEQKRQHAEARHYVSQVLTEALNDRQQKDNSVSKILVPIVEESVQKSVTQHRSQFIDYLYPLVGDLVRKFTTAFLRDFIEKTNEVIEKSVTLKSVGWRFRAWRSGVDYATYVASQTYVYQIQQVLLIHQETGLLLSSVNIDGKEDENSDIVSAMLTAINDFVSDSFATQTSSEHLDEIKTDSFTLYLRKGPKAFLVAAVTGNISPEAKAKLQTTLEHIHHLYMPQLDEFSGDTASFSSVESELQDCLISEEKASAKKHKKPLLAFLLIAVIAGLVAYWHFLDWQTNQAIQKIQDLPNDQGLVLTRIEKHGVHDIALIVMRDPRAISLEQWLEAANIQSDWLSYSEISYVSLAKPITANAIKSIANKYSNLQYDQENDTLIGELNTIDFAKLQDALERVYGSIDYPTQVNVSVTDTPIDREQALAATQQALNIMAGDIAQRQFTFDLASADITDAHILQAEQIALKFVRLKAYAEQVGLRPTLLVLGTSDQIGDLAVNQRLSIERAENARKVLLAEGLNEQDLLVSALGVVESGKGKINIRKAIITVVFNPR